MRTITNPSTGESITDNSNCGTGAGGFKPGNKRGKKGGGGKSPNAGKVRVTYREAAWGSLPAERTFASKKEANKFKKSVEKKGGEIHSVSIEREPNRSFSGKVKIESALRSGEFGEGSKIKIRSRLGMDGPHKITQVHSPSYVFARKIKGKGKLGKGNYIHTSEITHIRNEKGWIER